MLPWLAFYHASAKSLENESACPVKDVKLRHSLGMHCAEDVPHEELGDISLPDLDRAPVQAAGDSHWIPALWKPTLKDAERLKGEIKWSTEIYLGIKLRTSEAIIGTKDGLSYVEL